MKLKRQTVEYVCPIFRCAKQTFYGGISLPFSTISCGAAGRRPYRGRLQTNSLFSARSHSCTSFSVPTHSRWRAARNSQKKTKFCCKTLAEPYPLNLLLCSMLTLSSYRPFPYVSTQFLQLLSMLLSMLK